MVRVFAVGVVLSSTAFAQSSTVVFCATPALRAEVAKAIKEQGRTPLDLSEIDEALYGPDGARARVEKGENVTLPPSLPKELRADFAKGLAGCQARRKEGREDCADHLAAAVWERHLARLRPERVIEIKHDFDGALEMATYRPGDALIGGIFGDPNATIPYLVDSAITSWMPPAGSRPSTQLLPTERPPAPPRLTQGAPQSLTALRLPQGCTIPKELVVEPANAPLSTTMVALWRATAAGHVREGAEPERCKLELEKGVLRFACGAELAMLSLHPGTTFAEPEFQAGVARMFVEGQAHSACHR